MKKEYITVETGEIMAFYPELDRLLCDVRIQTDATNAERHRLYMTQNGRFYLIIDGREGRESKVIPQETALTFMRKYTAYILHDNYDEVFGEPERG